MTLKASDTYEFPCMISVFSWLQQSTTFLNNPVEL